MPAWVFDQVSFDIACAARAAMILQRTDAPANTDVCTVELFCRVYDVPCSACMALVTDLRNASDDQEMTSV